jgi:hypothetical protein
VKKWLLVGSQWSLIGEAGAAIEEVVQPGEGSAEVDRLPSLPARVSLSLAVACQLLT